MERTEPFGIWSVDKRFLIPFTGRYNVMVYECPSCMANLSKELYRHVIGLSWSPVGLVFIIECPKCFEKFYFHCDNEMAYECFLDTIEDGENIHFKNFKL